MPSGKEKTFILSPLAVFLMYVLYLAGQEGRPFLLRWIDGSFGFFVALVACNLLRRSLVGEKSSRGNDGEGPGK